MDWNRSIFDSTVRIYEVCDDYFLGKVFSRTAKLITSFKRGLLPALSFVFLAFGMIMLQPDLGTGTVMVGTCIIMIFISGARVFHFAMFGLIGVAGFVGLIASAPYRMKTHYIIFGIRGRIRSGVDFKLSNHYLQLDLVDYLGLDLDKVDKNFFIYLNHKLTLYLRSYPRN